MSAARQPHVRNALLTAAALLLPLVAACDIDARLAEDGSGTLTMRYRVQPDATEFLEKRRFASPHVTVDSMKIEEDLTAEVRASFDDVTQIATASAFRGVTVVRTPDGDAEWVVVTLRHPAGPAPKGNVSIARFSFTFPGTVVEANRHAETAGCRATWTFSLADYLREPVIDLRARYRRAPDKPTEDS